MDILFSENIGRALENKGIKSPKQLLKYSEADILELHDMGKPSIHKLTDALKSGGLKFKTGKE